MTNSIYERAAIPRKIWLTKQIPVTAVGKTFKPDLRRDATRHVLNERLADLAKVVHITVINDTKYAISAQIRMQQPTNNWQTIAIERLGLFKLHYNLETDD